jgi:8-oxo-dGTP pyrophosphatase MutT (NUDIX family)
MLHLIPAPLHRLGLRLAHRGRRQWLGWHGGIVTGCSVIALDEDQRVLLVRHSYGKGLWSFPGGGVRSSEEPHLAARREFAEELGCALDGLRHLGTQEEPFHGATNVVHIFAGQLAGSPCVDGREILEYRMFAASELPAACSVTVASRLALLEGGEG